MDINNYICDPFILITEISVLNNSKLGRVAQIFFSKLLDSLPAPVLSIFIIFYLTHVSKSAVSACISLARAPV